MKVLLADFSSALRAQGFVRWLQETDPAAVEYLDFTALDGTSCYCTQEPYILSQLPEHLPRVRWIDSGDYHYMSYLLASRETRPFHLLLMDHHPDNQEPAFGDVLSCGGWIRTIAARNPFLGSICTIGPEGCPSALAPSWIRERRGERVYVSLDKDILDPAFARTGWTQGNHSLESVFSTLEAVFGGMEVAAVDICGELPPSKGARADDQQTNLRTNQALYTFLTNHIT